MLSVARTIFGRLHEFEPAEEEAKLRVHEEDPQHGELSLSVPTPVTPPGQAVDNPISPRAHGEETKHTDTLTVNNPPKNPEGGIPSVVAPRPCKFQCVSLGPSFIFHSLQSDFLHS